MTLKTKVYFRPVCWGLALLRTILKWSTSSWKKLHGTQNVKTVMPWLHNWMMGVDRQKGWCRILPSLNQLGLQTFLQSSLACQPHSQKPCCGSVSRAYCKFNYKMRKKWENWFYTGTIWATMKDFWLCMNNSDVWSTVFHDHTLCIALWLDHHNHGPIIIIWP